LLEGARGEYGSGRLLDIGCGFGDFVALMQTKGWRAAGLDPSENAVAAATRKGIPVSRGTLEAFDAPAGTFDAITMFYVLEHLPDPMGALKKAYDLLLPGGTLVARVPHTTPIVRMLSPFGMGASLYDAPYHLYDFPPSVLGEMLRKAGFIEVRTFPGRPTCPTGLGARLASRVFGELAKVLYTASGGRFLLPGVSKTTIARKPA
jgi:SAM-dependent methyltransferase